MYKNNTLPRRIRRVLGFRDGEQICNECGKTFFNLVKSDICYMCWCIINKVDPL